MSSLKTLRQFVKKNYRILSTLSLSIITICAGRTLYCYIHRKYNKYPPGPIGLPFLGHLFSMLKPVKLESYLAATYGAISMVYVAQQPFIFLHSIDLINEIFNNEYALKRDKWHKGFLFDEHKPHELPTSNASSPFWMKKRKILQSVLLSRLHSEFLNEAHNTSITEISPSIQHCIEKNKLWYPSKDIQYIMFNAIWSAVFGSYVPFQSDIHHKIVKFVHHVPEQALLDIGIMQFGLKNILPSSWCLCTIKQFSQYIETLIYDELGYDEQIWNMKDLKWSKHFEEVHRDKKSCLISKLIAVHRHKPDIDSTKRALLAEICISLFTAGIETTENVTEYGVVLLGKYSKYQFMIYNELYSVFGDDWKMKQNSFKSAILKLHYFRAFIHETLRLSAVLPFGIPHRNDVDIWTKDKKYKIPKNSVIISDVYSANKCDPHWVKRTNGNTNSLCLEAWLDDKGHFSRNLNKDKMVSFSVGARDCAGKAFGLRNLYVLFIKLILNFKFKVKDEQIEINQIFTFTQHIHPKIGLRVTRRIHS